MLDLQKTVENGKGLYILKGRLDTMSSPELEREIKASLDSLHELILDFEGLEYISSAGLRILLSAQKVMNRQGSMKILHVNKAIMEVFELTGFAEILTIQ